MKVFCLKRGSSPFKSRSFVITITGLIITVFIYLLSMTVLTKDIKNTQNLQKVTKVSLFTFYFDVFLNVNFFSFVL